MSLGRSWLRSIKRIIRVSEMKNVRLKSHMRTLGVNNNPSAFNRRYQCKSDAFANNFII